MDSCYKRDPSRVAKTIISIHLLSAFRKGVVLRKLQRLGLRGS